MITHCNTGSGASPRKNPPVGAFTHTIPPTPASAKTIIVKALRHFHTAQASGLAQNVEEYHFRLAIDEMLTNAIKHGAPSAKRREESVDVRSADPGCEDEITLTVRYTKKGVKIAVRDHGAGFDPEAVEDPRLPERRYRSGGRGVWLMKALGEVTCRGDCVEVRL